MYLKTILNSKQKFSKNCSSIEHFDLKQIKICTYLVTKLINAIIIYLNNILYIYIIKNIVYETKNCFNTT